MPATPVVIVLHNHQPVGNLPWVYGDCFRAAYAPFLDVLARHPGIKVGLHYTGPLFEWLQQYQPGYLARVRALVDAGQVEVLGGAFYEPILPVIPERDRVGQLRLMREAVTETFGRAPEGAWLAERVWEPGLPPALAAAGVRYVLIDDEAFHRLGYSDVETRATYLTEDQGAMVRLVPISRQLRYTIPTAMPEEVVATLHAMAAEGAEALIYAEDGERFGAWPGTHPYLYGDEAYLDRLFTALEEDEALTCVLPGDYVRACPPRGRVYLPPASYREMQTWSGGFWRNFLVRYRESNRMHKKMLLVSGWVQAAEEAGAPMVLARRDLYAGQCNCAYWYGAFGGLYLPHLRRAIYHHLLRAERAAVPWLPAGMRPPCEIADLDLDGHDEVYLRNGEVSIGIAPHQGGGVFALEHLGVAHDFLATMGRHPLPQQEEEVSAPEAPVDWYPRFALLDHILAAETTAATMCDGDCGEQGDFVLGAYAVTETGPAHVVLQRDGHFWDGPTFAPLRVEKRLTLRGDGLHAAYTLTNTSDAPRTFRFAVELETCLTAGDAEGRDLIVASTAGETPVRLEDTASTPGCYGVRYRDAWLGMALALSWSVPTEAWSFPCRTPLRSLEGLEWVYQSTVTVPVWPVTLMPGAHWDVEISATLMPIALQAGRATAATAARGEGADVRVQDKARRL